MTHRKKLIEVALPLEAINKASAKEKSIRHGHPSTLHLWWARRPLAAARAVIFAQMVDDPSGYVDELLADAGKRQQAEAQLQIQLAQWEQLQREARETGGFDSSDPPTLAEVAAEIERQRLFRLIEDLVLWENTTNEKVLEPARAEIRKSWRRTCAQNKDHPQAAELFNPDKLPAFHDPFAGGGALPLEAQRLGLESYASDLNPVAVLINKAMIEIPPKFANRPPVNPESRGNALSGGSWKGAAGLAEDVRYYGKWMRDEAEKRIGHLYPKIEITEEMATERPDLKKYVGQKLTVIAWLWARTVKSPNPAFADVDVPLASTFMLSTKPGKEAYVEPVIQHSSPGERGAGDEGQPSYRFAVKTGKPKDAEAAKNGTKLSRGANFRCMMSGAPIAGSYIKAEGKAGRMGARLMAIVAEGERGRVYLSPTPEHEAAAKKAEPEWKPDGAFIEDARAFTPSIYGLGEWNRLFMDRQLVAMATLADLVKEAITRVRNDVIAAGLAGDGEPLCNGGSGGQAYGDAVGAYLALTVSRQANRCSTLNFWDTKGENVQQVFARQALSMTWDFVEGNLLSNSTGNYTGQVDYLTRVVEDTLPASARGTVLQQDAQTQQISSEKVVSTDPPYYDNVPYADLSDYFYIWLRRCLRDVFPDLLATVGVPKYEELVAFPYRNRTKIEAEVFFLDGMTEAMHRLATQSHLTFPVTVYYAFRQSETDDEAGTASTGWDTFLDAVIRAGFGISGTWPMRTEYTGNLKTQRNALASSIILVCRKRAADAKTVTRREFVATLKAELPQALAHLQHGNIAPVDLAQAAIGPGMGVYTRYAKVLDSEGKPVPVREALALINQTLDEVLAEQEGDFDADSRWALAWFEQMGFNDGPYGDAELLSKAKVTSVKGLEAAGIIKQGPGRVRLLRPPELPTDWNPATDPRLTAWEVVHQLIRVLEAGGESAAAAMVAKLGAKAELARELAYRLYTLCERKKRAAEALSYNALVQSWPEINRLAGEAREEVAEGSQQFGFEF